MIDGGSQAANISKPKTETAHSPAGTPGRDSTVPTVRRPAPATSGVSNLRLL